MIFIYSSAHFCKYVLMHSIPENQYVCTEIIGEYKQKMYNSFSIFILNLLVGLVVKASTSRAEKRFESRLRRDFSGSSLTSDLKKMAPQWLPCQAPGIIGSALGLVGPVSVYCDCVRWEF